MSKEERLIAARQAANDAEEREYNRIFREGLRRNARQLTRWVAGGVAACLIGLAVVHATGIASPALLALMLSAWFVAAIAAIAVALSRRSCPRCGQLAIRNSDIELPRYWFCDGCSLFLDDMRLLAPDPPAAKDPP